MRNPLSERIVEIPFSGIRKFFDIAAEMKDVISGVRCLMTMIQR